ncbi:MAG: hypothetical protein ABIU18_01965 [Novosphingobium sp.]
MALFYPFTLSLCDVDELLTQSGIDVSYETIRCWTMKSGPAIAAHIRRQRARADRVWHLDEMVVKIRGQRMYMWRAFSQARARGCQTLDGSGMVVFQAAAAFAIFTGHQANPTRMRQSFLA